MVQARSVMLARVASRSYASSLHSAVYGHPLHSPLDTCSSSPAPACGGSRVSCALVFWGMHENQAHAGGCPAMLMRRPYGPVPVQARGTTGWKLRQLCAMPCGTRCCRSGRPWAIEQGSSPVSGRLRHSFRSRCAGGPLPSRAVQEPGGTGAQVCGRHRWAGG